MEFRDGHSTTGRAVWWQDGCRLCVQKGLFKEALAQSIDGIELPWRERRRERNLPGVGAWGVRCSRGDGSCKGDLSVLENPERQGEHRSVADHALTPRPRRIVCVDRDATLEIRVVWLRGVGRWALEPQPQAGTRCGARGC